MEIVVVEVSSMSVTPMRDFEIYAVLRVEGDLFKGVRNVQLPFPSCDKGIYFLVDENSLKLRSLNLNVEIWQKELPGKKNGGEKKIGEVLIPVEELIGNQYSGSYELRGKASGEAKVMLNLSVKNIVNVIMPINGPDNAAARALEYIERNHEPVPTYKAYRYTPPQPNTGFIPAPGLLPPYTQGAYIPYNPSNPYLAPSNQFVPPVSHGYNHYNQGYPPYDQGYPPYHQGYPPFHPFYAYNPDNQGYPPDHGYSHALQQSTSISEWVRTGLGVVRGLLLLYALSEGLDGGDFGGF